MHLFLNMRINIYFKFTHTQQQDYRAVELDPKQFWMAGAGAKIFLDCGAAA